MHISRRSGAPFFALMMGMFLAQLDTNVITPALPVITRELRAPEAISAIAAVYLLAVSVATPVLGLLGDRWGRRRVYTLSMVFFLAGSTLCALAPTMWLLVMGRAVQGVGGGGLVVTAVSALAQMYDRAELVRRQVWVTACFALSALSGPTIGGLVASGPGWRWAFVLNLPLAAAGLALARDLPSRAEPSVQGSSRFDVTGAVLVVTFGAAVVALGSAPQVSASAAATTVLVLLAAVVAVVLYGVESRADQPLIPVAQLHGTLGAAVRATALSGIALFGIFTFVPLLIQHATGLDSGGTGLAMTALTAGQLVATLAFATWARQHPTFAAAGRTGLILGVTGLALLCVLTALPGSTPAALTWGLLLSGLILAGAALGLSMQAYTLLAQTHSQPDQFGATMGALTFSRQVGGALGTSLLGWTHQATTPALTATYAAATTALLLAALTSPSESRP